VRCRLGLGKWGRHAVQGSYQIRGMSYPDIPSQGGGRTSVMTEPFHVPPELEKDSGVRFDFDKLGIRLVTSHF
jgi:hypothetical protein